MSDIVHDTKLKPYTAVAARAQPVSMLGERSGGYPPTHMRCFPDVMFAGLPPRKRVCKPFFAVFLLKGVALQHVYLADVHG